MSKRGGEKRKNIQHPKHRLLCMLFKWCHREKKNNTYSDNFSKNERFNRISGASIASNPPSFK